MSGMVSLFHRDFGPYGPVPFQRQLGVKQVYPKPNQLLVNLRSLIRSKQKSASKRQEEEEERKKKMKKNRSNSQFLALRATLCLWRTAEHDIE